MNTQCEILSPAGGPGALKAAVINGADAVYLGLDLFSARASADNFTPENLRTWVKYAHLYGVKVYVALNTVVKDSEMDEALRYAACAREAKADAVIVQDLGLIANIFRTMPDIVLHGSTQMGIHNLEGALEAEKLGLKRIVLARETPLKEIERIGRETNLELEYFVHGALCVGFSGNCYISSMVSGFSGNRGRCLQLCRKRYSVACGGKTFDGYYLSPADLCLLDRLAELWDAGIFSFKIEGRLKRSEYVGEITRIYKKALGGEAPNETDRENLLVLFNRGEFCGGYLDGDKVIYPYAQNHIGRKIGKVEAVKGRVAEMRTSIPVLSGDGVKFMREKRESGWAECAGGSRTTFIGNVRAGDEIRLTTSAALMREINARKRRIPVSVACTVKGGEPVRFTAQADGVAAEATGENAQPAGSSPIGEAELLRTLNKSGEYFVVSDAAIETDGASFVPQSRLNGLRRNLFAELENRLIAEFERKSSGRNAKTTVGSSVFSLNSYSMSDIVYRIDENAPLISDAKCVLLAPKDYKNHAFIDAAAREYEMLILELPIMADDADMEILRKLADKPEINYVCANNLYGFSFSASKPVLTGYGLNPINRNFEGNFMQSIESDKILSPDRYVYAFGYPPLMTFRHCPRKALYGGCAGCRGDYRYELSDEKGRFVVRHYAIENCYAYLTNSKPVALFDEMRKYGHKKMIIDLTGASEADIMSASGQTYGREHVHFNFNKKLV